MQVQVERNDTLLRSTLYGNVAFTVVCLTSFLLAAQSIANFMGITYQWLFYLLGVGFIPFAAFVFWTASKQPINGRLVQTVIMMDVTWVVVSYLFLIFAWTDLTVGGRWFVFLQAEAVSIFAFFQYTGLRRIR